MDLEVEYLAWVAFHKPQMNPDHDDGRTDAWLEAVGRGEYQGTDAELAAFAAAWDAAHAKAPESDDPAWDVLADGRDW